MQYYMSLAEIQDRIKTLITHFSSQSMGNSPYNNQDLASAVKKLADPNLLNNEKVEEEIIASLLNAIVMAGQLNIDIESKINEYLLQLERESLFAM